MINQTSCAACKSPVSPFAAACPQCGDPFKADRPSVLGVVLCLVSWVIAFASAMRGGTDIQLTLAAAVGAGGIAWLAALRVSRPIPGRLLTAPQAP